MSINPNLIKKFKKKFAKFMESHRTDTADFTHLSMGGLYSHGRFNISDKKDLNKLVKYLAEALELNMNFSILNCSFNLFGAISCLLCVKLCALIICSIFHLLIRDVFLTINLIQKF